MNREEVNNNSNNNNEANKIKLSFLMEIGSTLIIERLKSLSVISTVAFALVGISISADSIIFKNIKFAYASFILLILIALISFYKYLHDTRSEINNLRKEIKKFETKNLDRSSEIEERESKIIDFWPEFFFGVLVFAIILFILSLFDICKYLC